MLGGGAPGGTGPAGGGAPPNGPGGAMVPAMPGSMPQMQGMPGGCPMGMNGARPNGMGMPGMPGMPNMPGGMPGSMGMMPCMGPGGMPGNTMPGGGMGGMPGMMGGMNPMMNPMMMMMMQQMQQMQQKSQGTGGGGGGNSAGSKVESRPSAPEPDDDDAIDPDVQELCDYFNIEDRWIKRLNETMKKRQDTKAEDLEKLYETLERARSPTGLLTVKIGEMESGRFIGKVKPDKEVERLARKFRLDDPVASRFTELIHRRKKDGEIDRMHKDLNTIEQHLRHCKRANALATLLVGKLLEGEVDELPDLTEAEQVMEKYRLDEDAKSKLREIIEKRAEDKNEILVRVRKHLDNCTNPSSMLCKIARPLIDNENLPDPPERPQGKGEKGGGKGKDRHDRDRQDRGHDRTERRRSRSRRRRSRSRRRDGRSRSRRRSHSRKRSGDRDKDREKEKDKEKDEKEKEEQEKAIDKPEE